MNTSGTNQGTLLTMLNNERLGVRLTLFTATGIQRKAEEQTEDSGDVPVKMLLYGPAIPRKLKRTSP